MSPARGVRPSPARSCLDRTTSPQCAGAPAITLRRGWLLLCPGTPSLHAWLLSRGHWVRGSPSPEPLARTMDSPLQALLPSSCCSCPPCVWGPAWGLRRGQGQGRAVTHWGLRPHMYLPSPVTWADDVTWMFSRGHPPPCAYPVGFCGPYANPPMQGLAQCLAGIGHSVDTGASPSVTPVRMAQNVCREGEVPADQLHQACHGRSTPAEHASASCKGWVTFMPQLWVCIRALLLARTGPSLLGHGVVSPRALL